jgi:hypothetical protein
MRIGRWGWILGGVAVLATAGYTLVSRYAINVPGWITD